MPEYSLSIWLILVVVLQQQEQLKTTMRLQLLYLGLFIEYVCLSRSDATLLYRLSQNDLLVVVFMAVYVALSRFAILKPVGLHSLKQQVALLLHSLLFPLSCFCFLFLHFICALISL